MGALIARKFEKEGDVELVCDRFLLSMLTDREARSGSGPCSKIIRSSAYKRACVHICGQGTGDIAALTGERGQRCIRSSHRASCETDMVIVASGGSIK